MRINDYSGEIVNFDDAQFAISIALAQLNEPKAATAVRRFMGTYLNNEKPDEVSRLLAKRRHVEEELKRTGKCMVLSVLELLNEPGALEITVSCSNSILARKSLHELLKTTTFEAIYQQTMRLLYWYDTRELIMVYMSTQEYVATFVSDLRKRMIKSADGYRNNNLDDQVVYEVLQDFRDWVWRNSTNGAYSTSTCSPIAFLRNAFKSMYAVNDATNFYSILNRSGLNAGLGEESMGATALSFIGVDSNTTSVNIDFVDVADKINRASRLMFNHSDNEEAFYDIFSCYRDRILRSKLEECKRDLVRAVSGCTFEIMDSANDADAGHLGAVKNKKAGRIKLCQVFEPIITNGISQKDVHALYLKALACTDTLSVKDGVRLFSTAKHVTKHYETNSEMLQIIISGHLAVRDLILYLESERSVSTIYSFPTIIFRDPRYLRRFQTIEEYVSYYPEVTALIEEVQSDGSRNRPFIGGLYSNDAVWDYLGTCNVLNATIYRRLMNTPLGYIRNAVLDSQVIGRDKKLLESIDKSYDVYFGMQSLIDSNLSSGGYADSLNGVDRVCGWICGSFFDDTEDSKRYALCLLFAKELEHVMGIEGASVVGEDGAFLLKAETFKDECLATLKRLHPKFGSNESAWERLLQSMRLRIAAMKKCYAFVSGSECECGWEQARNLFSFCSLLETMVEQYSERLGSLKNYDEKWLYLLLASIAESPELFKIPKVCTSCNDFAFLLNNRELKYSLGEEFSIKEVLDINDKRNAFFVVCMNLFLDRCSDGHEDFSIAFELMDKYVSDRYSPVVVETSNDQILANASYDIGRSQTGGDSTIRMLLDGMLEFDSLGYAVLGNERLTIGSLFIIRYGYFIELNEFANSYICEKISHEDLPKIRAAITSVLSR